MEIINHLPSPDAQRLIKKMWVVEEDSGLNLCVHSFPVGYPFINVISGSNFDLVTTKDKPLSVRSYISSIALDPFTLNMRLVKRSLIIQLHPYALPLLFGWPASEMQGQVYSLENIAPHISQNLECLLQSELPSIQVLAQSEKILTERSQSMTDPRFLQALYRIIHTGGDESISNLSNEVNLSKRRLQQLFKQHLGMSAKSYSRIMRIQKLTYQLLEGQSLDYLIPDSYFDQAHFVHDIKSQTGMSPSAYKNYITDPIRSAAYKNSNLYHPH